MPMPCVLRVLPVLILMSGCDWVDSTGSQSGNSPPILLDGDSSGEIRGFEENKSTTFLADTLGAGADATYTWDEVPPGDAPLGVCEAEPDYRSDLAVRTLAEACTDPDDCALGFDPQQTDVAGRVAYNLRVPRLKAPVGVQRKLRIESLSEGNREVTYDFCLIAINEGPSPGNDGPYDVVEGTTLIIGDDEPGLLANDEDDIDVGNLDELVIRQAPHRAPGLASDFEILPDGGFRYSYAETGLDSPLTDSFEYTVFDGSHESIGLVDIRILPANRPPEQPDDIPAQTVTVDSLVGIDLSEYFRDPEGAELGFLADEATLPSSRSLLLTSSGVLRGFPVEDDVGDYEVTLVVSDGDRELFSSFMLSIEPSSNRAPVFVDGSIDDVIVPLREEMQPLEPTFTDPDGDDLTYQLFGFVPRGVSVDPDTGIVSGAPRQRGIFRGLIVRATDPDGASADSQRFAIRVF